MNDHQRRKPSGSPAGGEFSARSGAEAPLNLAANTWPPVTFEQLAWRLPAEFEGHVDVFVRRRLESTPYDAAVPPEIADLDPETGLSPTVRSAVSDALTTMALFDAETSNLPVPMPAVLLRTESASSSQIEQLTANSRNLALAMLGETSGPNAAEVAANARAMTKAIATDGPLDTDTIQQIHHALMATSSADIAGQLRDGPVWIGRPDISPHGADFTPPQAARIPAALEDLAVFAERTDINTLVKAAVTHAQFETIHPFFDGNGRTGRALVHTMLRRSGHVRHSTVPVSAGLLADTDGYFRAITAYRAGDAEPIIEAFAGAATRAVANGRQLAADTIALHDSWQTKVTARSDSSAWRLAKILFAQPVVTSTYVERELEVSKQGAFNAINTLTDAGVLAQSSRDRRNRVWAAPEVLTAMDAFAARAARRQS